MCTNKLINAVILIILFVLSSSCKKTGIVDPKIVTEIEVYSIKKGTEYVHAINSLDAVKREGKDSTITDRDFINRFISLINDLQVDKNDTDPTGDFRVAAIIRIAGKRPRTILFGEYFGTVYQDRRMIDNKKLFHFIDERIYGPHPYEWWLTEQEKTIQRAMKKILEEGVHFP